jgi:hypothetical protein
MRGSIPPERTGLIPPGVGVLSLVVLADLLVLAAIVVIAIELM